jgi:prophage regulatory protein
MPAKKRAIRWRELKEKVPWSRAYVLRMEREGKFPRRFYLGPQTAAWWESEIDTWLEERAAEREVA